MEFSEDLARNGVVYAEPRFCPHLMLSEDVPEVKAKHVVQTVLEGLREGEQLYGVRRRQLSYMPFHLAFGVVDESS